MDKKQLNWFALDIYANSDASEAIEFALNELDALGTEINNLGKVQTETLRIIGYFNAPIDNESVKSQIEESLRIYGFSPDAVQSTDWRKMGDTDWLFEWKKHWKPTESGKFIIAPTWENVDESKKIVIRIEPSMAFGTGTHETTRLCLKAIEETYQPDETFFDVGTGTGILAIAVAKLNNHSQKPQILGCDTDFDSITIAKENAELNNTPEVEFYVGSISEETNEFDYLCANVTLDVITPLLPLLMKKSRRILVLSGILKEQESAIIQELHKFDVENLKIETMGEWISVQISK